MNDQAERLRELIQKQDNFEPLVSPKKATSQRTRVVAVTSGKGGVGKTNLSVNLSIAMLQLGSRVLLVDADLGMANVDMMLGLIPKYNLGHVLRGQRNIDEIIVNGPLGMKIIASGSGDYKMSNLNDRSLEFCLEKLSDIEKNVDVMLIDTGAGISRNVLKFVLAAEEVIIVTTPEPTAITDAYGIIKVIASANTNIPIWVVVNMVKDEAESKAVMERLAAVSKQFLDVQLTGIGFIPSDPNVPKSVKEQQPFMLSKPRSSAAQSVMKIAKRLLESSSSEKRSGNFFERVIRGVFN